ncbi:hypothetical protein [Vibrio hepatarius]|uniref:hypothetical protein n=1 Tax=Vibrio hepatarius TaxID=171383 RepID=UPI003735F4AC
MSFIYIPPTPEGKTGLVLTDAMHIDDISSRVDASEWRRVWLPQHAVKINVTVNRDVILNFSTKPSLDEGLFYGEAIENYGAMFHRSITLPPGLTEFYMEWRFYNAPDGYQIPDVHMQFETQEP